MQPVSASGGMQRPVNLSNQPVQSQKKGEQMTLVFLGGMLMGFGFGLIAAALFARYDDMKNEIEELKKGKK